MSRYHYNPSTGEMTIARKPKPAKKRQGRSLTIVGDDLLSSSWLTSLTGPNTGFEGGLRRVIDMARELEEDPYGASFYGLWERGVVGSQGFTLESRPVNIVKGEPVVDEPDKNTIEQAWKEWRKPANCTVTADMPWCEAKKLNERTYSRDGAILIRKLQGWQDNEFKFAVQLLEPDMIDLNYTVERKGRGNRIVMGKEINRFGKCVAYWILGDHPGERYQSSGITRTRVPASQIIHRFHRNRILRQHGLPMMLASFKALRHRGEYEEAENIAARAHACAMLKLEDTDGVTPPRDPNNPDEQDFEFVIEKGGVLDIPFGKQAELTQPQHPNSNFREFNKAVLMGVAAGANVHYNQLAGDLESINYSSYKAGNVPLKQLFRLARHLNIQIEEEPIFLAWLDTQLRLDLIGLPFSKWDKLKQHKFHCEKLPPIEPEKEMRAHIMALGAGLTTPSKVWAEYHNEPFEDGLKQIGRDRAIMEQELGGVPEWAKLLPDTVVEPGPSQQTAP